MRRHSCRQCCRIPTAGPAVCAAVCRSAAARCPVLGEWPAGAPPLLPPTTNRALNPKPCPIAECSNRAGGTGNRCRGGHGPRTALGLLRVRLCTRRPSCPGRLPSTCTLEAHPPRGRPNGRPGAGRRCWAAAVAACGRGLQPATSRRRPGAGTRKGVPGRRKRRPPPGGRPRGSSSGSRRHGRCRPHPCSRRGGRHRKPRWPLSQAARAPPICRRSRAARLTAGATSGRTASVAPGVPRAGADSNCPGGQGSVGQRGAAALASSVRGPWPSRVVNIFAAVCSRSVCVLAARVRAGRPCPRGRAGEGRPGRRWTSWLAAGVEALRPQSGRVLAGRSCRGIPFFFPATTRSRSSTSTPGTSL